jgi:two-component system, NarL family, sensor histidine kinase UhpB
VTVLSQSFNEMLDRVVRHARATRATVALSHSDGFVELQVADDGAGIDAAATDGAGIRGMRERAVLIGGVLSVGPSSAGGTCVRLAVPVIVEPE